MMPMSIFFIKSGTKDSAHIFKKDYNKNLSSHMQKIFFLTSMSLLKIEFL